MVELDVVYVSDLYALKFKIHEQFKTALFLRHFSTPSEIFSEISWSRVFNVSNDTKISQLEHVEI